MPLTELNHFFVRANDLERSRRFYCDALGFEVMPRPAFPFPGYWLGVSGKVQIHMGPDGIADQARYYLGSAPGVAKDNAGVIDHIAFQGTRPDELAQRLAQLGLASRTRHIPEIALLQIFVADPDGLTIEMNFPGVVTPPAGAEVLGD